MKDCHPCAACVADLIGLAFKQIPPHYALSFSPGNHKVVVNRIANFCCAKDWRTLLRVAFQRKNAQISCNCIPGFSLLVRMKGLEPSRDKALVPKTSVSTNFTTSASIGTANIDRKITLREKMIGWLEKLTLLKILTHGKF